METSELMRLKDELDAFVSEFDDCIKTRPSRGHLRTYMAGLLGPLKRKNVEAIALEAGAPVRTLQEFLSFHRWDDAAVARQVRELVRLRHASTDAIGVIDETSFAKKGKKTAGVKRQHCGSTGKIDNCVVTVHLGYVADEFHALLDSALFVPEEWAHDAERCREAGLPESTEHRPKTKIAIDLVRQAVEEGIELRWLTADELYGRSAEFRESVVALGLHYAVEIPRTLTGWTRRPRVEPAGARPTGGRGGRPRKHARLAKDAPKARPVERLWKRGGPSWHLFRIKDTEKGPEVWRVRETRFFPWRREGTTGIAGGECRLIIAVNVLTEERKYFLTSAPRDIPLKTILGVLFSRVHIEQVFREAKDAVGLDHFQVRRHEALRRHLVVTALAVLFLAEQTDRLRGEKSVVDPVPNPRGRGSTARPGHGEVGAPAPCREDSQPDHVPPTACGRGGQKSHQTTEARTSRGRHRPTPRAAMPALSGEAPAANQWGKVAL
ncbi:IS701 family transposase [Planctomycetota bacterium]